MAKLAMVDVDGTLRHVDDWKAHAVEFVDYLGSSGYTVALCSGRHPDALRQVAAELPAVSYISAAGGSMVRRLEGGAWLSVADRFLDSDLVTSVANESRRLGLELWAYTPTSWIVTTISQAVQNDVDMTGARPQLGEIEGLTDVIKLETLPRTAAHRAFLETMAANPDVRVVESYPGYDDIVPAGSAETKGGDFLIADLGLTWGDVVAVGDGQNDLGMLGKAGTAFLLRPLTTAQLTPAQNGQSRHEVSDLGEVLHTLRTAQLSVEGNAS